MFCRTKLGVVLCGGIPRWFQTTQQDGQRHRSRRDGVVLPSPQTNTVHRDLRTRPPWSKMPLPDRMLLHLQLLQPPPIKHVSLNFQSILGNGRDYYTIVVFLTHLVYDRCTPSSLKDASDHLLREISRAATTDDADGNNTTMAEMSPDKVKERVEEVSVAVRRL